VVGQNNRPFALVHNAAVRVSGENCGDGFVLNQVLKLWVQILCGVYEDDAHKSVAFSLV